MPLLSKLSPLDEYLLNRVDIALQKLRSPQYPQISIRYNNRHSRVINPATVLKIIVRNCDLNELLGEDADYEPLAKIARGNLKGGGITKRDKWYGYENNVKFKRWWHRVGKNSLGRDLRSKAEADSWHNVYLGCQYFLANSTIYASISLLNFREQKAARSLLAILSVRCFLRSQADSFQPPLTLVR